MQLNKENNVKFMFVRYQLLNAHSKCSVLKVDIEISNMKNGYFNVVTITMFNKIYLKADRLTKLGAQQYNVAIFRMRSAFTLRDSKT